MRILQIINRFDSGGAEKLLLETIPLYNTKGIHVDLLLLNGKDLPFLKVLKNLDCCTIYSLGSFSVYNPIHIFKIIPFLKRYDIVHAHLFPSQYWVVFAKLFSFSKIKIVVTEHSSSNPRINNFFISKIDRFIYRFYQKVICITDNVHQIIKNHTKLSDTKFEVIENGINLKAIENAKPFPIKEISNLLTDQDILLIHIARFSKHKDPQTVIKSMKYLPDNFKLLFVGDGDTKKENENLTKKLELENSIIFLGARTDISRLLKTVNISILSSNGEGFGLTAIESMASGIPFIASDVIGLSDLVGDTGILFEKGNEMDLAFKIKKLVSDNNFRIEVVNACKQKAKKFDIELMVEKHITLYKSMYDNASFN